MTDAYVPKPDGPEMLKPKRRSITSTSVDLSPSAECQGCDWRIGQSPSATAQAHAHALDLGHEVVVDEIRRTVVTAS